MSIKKVGIFDSGVGGLTVVKEVRNNFPYLDLFYLGDTARLPYGDKSEETIINYSYKNAKFLLSYDIDLLIVACNTSSSFSLPFLEKEFKFPIVGMIAPGAALALKKTKNKKIGLIGTRATIRSQSYRKEIENIDNKAEVFDASCPLFVPLVEEGFFEDEVTEIVAKRYLKGLEEKGIDTLILGCTHYPVLTPTLKKILPNVEMISSGEATVVHLKDNFGLIINPVQSSSKKGNLRVFATDTGTHFKEVAEKLLGEKIELESAAL
jgi:glutamate racemase